MSTFVTYASIMAACTAVGWGLSRFLGAGQRTSDPIRKHPRGMHEAEPYRLSGSLLTEAELSFYRKLLPLVSPGNTVFAKVRLADLLQVNFGAADRKNAHERIGNKSLTFVVCDESLIPRLAVSLDEGTDDRTQLRSREFVMRVCTKAGLPLVRLPLRSSYEESEIRSAIEPLLTTSA